MVGFDIERAGHLFNIPEEFEIRPMIALASSVAY
jgi:hypothetical protein